MCMLHCLWNRLAAHVDNTCVPVCVSVRTATLIDPDGFTVMIVDPSADSDPVTANYSWAALDSVQSQNITYTVSITYENDTVVAGQSTTHPSSSLEVSDLPACANLTATLVAERNNESSNGTVEQFSTSEPSGESVSCTCIIVEEGMDTFNYFPIHSVQTQSVLE